MLLITHMHIDNVNQNLSTESLISKIYLQSPFLLKCIWEDPE